MKDLIIKEAINEIIKYGFKKFTMHDIASSLQISKKSIYKYFPSKEALIDETIDFIFSRELLRNAEIINSDIPIEEKLENIIMITLTQELPLSYVLEIKVLYPDFWAKIDSFATEKRQLVCNLIQKGLDEGTIQEGVDPHITALALETFIYSVISSPTKEFNQINLIDLLKKLQQIFLYGIIKKSPEEEIKK